jgi:mevalonate kinase
MLTLATPAVVGVAFGKAILIGEHAAVEGHMAIALPLREQSLTIRFGESLEESAEQLSGWDKAWSLTMSRTPVPLPTEERRRLTQTLQLAAELISRELAHPLSLELFRPQRIEIISELPLGAGMGGSAALSAALVRALVNSQKKTLPTERIAFLANELDAVFHGRASGLDAAAVVSESLLSFTKSEGPKPIRNKTGFWVLLIDTIERTPTREMVQRVAQLRTIKPALVDQLMKQLGQLSCQARHHLECGELLRLGEDLNQAHAALADLGVSTPSLDACVEAMRDAGALGAKLTGGGGGGLALGIFASRPEIHRFAAWSDSRHYLTFVGPSENP